MAPGTQGLPGVKGFFFFDIYRADVQATGISAGDFFCVDRGKVEIVL